MKQNCFVSFLLFAVMGWFSTAQAHDYQKVFLTIPNQLVQTNDINNNNELVGTYLSNSFEQFGFIHNLESNTTQQLIVDLPDAQSNANTVATGTNDMGDIVGTYDGFFFDTNGNGHATTLGFVYDGNSYTKVQYLDANTTILADINNSGVAVGASSGRPENNIGGFIYSAGSFTKLTLPNTGPDDAIVPAGINDNGFIVGRFSSNGVSHGFVKYGASMTVLDYPGATQTYPQSINNSGVVVGFYNISPGGEDLNGFLWDGTTYYPIKYPSNSRSMATGINDVGNIVGDRVVAQSSYIAYWQTGDPLWTEPPPPPDTTPQAISSANIRYAASNLDPINTFNGELYTQKERELNLGGPMSLYFQRYYASYLRRSFIVGDLGSNWRHNFDARLYQLPTGTDYKYVSHDGRVTEFVLDQGTGDWNQQTNLDTPYQITIVDSQDAVLYDPEVGKVYTFDFTTGNTIIGKLIKIEDGHGNTHTVTYDLANGHIQMVADGLGRTLNFTYNNDTVPKISAVDDGTRSISFQYTDPIDTEYLTTVIDARLGTTKYVYKDTSTVADHALMTAMTRPRGNTPYTQTFYDTNTPLASGRVATQTNASGNIYTMEYNDLDTTIVDPLSSNRTHSHTSTGELAGSQDSEDQIITIGSDTTGRRNSITDRMGDLTTMSYDSTSGNLTDISNADGTSASRSFTSRSFGNVSMYDLSGVTNEDTTTESFSYDVNGNLILHTDRAGNTSSATYNNKGQALTVTNVLGGTSTNTYNADATLNTTKDAVNNTTTAGYDALRRLNVLTYTDANEQSMTYDNGNNLLTITDENDGVTTFTYDANSNLSSAQNPLLNTTNFTYDGNDRLISTTDPLGGVSSRSLNELSLVTSTTDPNGNQTTLGYDIHNRLNSVTDPLLNVWTTTYDLEGIVATTSNPLGHTTSFTSDTMGRITEVTSPLGFSNSVTYDAIGRIINSTDALSQVTTLTRGSRGYLSSVSLSEGTISAQYSRNASGQITAVTDPAGNDWSSTYDNMGRQTASIDPLANMHTISYDNRNRPATLTFPAGLGSATLNYDAKGNLTNSNYSDGTNFNFTYDANDRLITANGIALAYDASDRLISSNNITVVRDIGGRITNMTLATEKVVSYVYDANNRLTQVNDWAGGTTTFNYDAAGRLIAILRSNGVNGNQSYDEDNHLVGLTEETTTTDISMISLTRDGNGQVINATRSVPLIATAINQNATSQTVDAASQLTSASYDAKGRTISEGSNSFTWNLASQLTSFTTASGNTTATYDVNGNRLSKTTAGITQGYTWNYALGLPSISIEKTDGTDSKYFIHTPTGALLYSIDAITNARHFYHYDEMGNTLFITDDSANVVASYAYTPFGKLIAETGTLDNPYKWQGQFGIMDEGAGFYYIRARYYDANYGRFISRDPVKSIYPIDVNPYQYAASNPLKYIDVDGLERDVGEWWDRIRAKNEFRDKYPDSMSRLMASTVSGNDQSDIVTGKIWMAGIIRGMGPASPWNAREHMHADSIKSDYRLSRQFLGLFTGNSDLAADEIGGNHIDDWLDEQDRKDRNRIAFDNNAFLKRYNESNNHLFAVGFPGAFEEVDLNLNWEGLNDPWSYNNEPLKPRPLTPNDYGVAIEITDLIRATHQTLDYLNLALSSNRESVKVPTNPDKGNSVIQELKQCIIGC